MNIPKELKYSSDHEWVAVVGGRTRIGITDYAQDALGDVVYVDLPQVGDHMAAGSVFGEVESTKSVSELFAPLSGTVVAINDALEGTPELVNSDAYGEGWICELEGTDHGEYEALLDAAAYQELLEGEG
ncbi:MAG: glycine cleavage system protein GcvH [Actinobacteria bacterium]|jgi:glycine cleavage system H protein|nr:glycine cleavage system protein GcvH [Actinomycetota bacterium]MBT3746991.1 glycine cleavage system protein GcvH [Actinomycetota bacterium]MBT3970543.1 glycine cleavage system protein GcvH [Actinomycetota bacterium]MBT4010403.1 glycine cleavage system protein GcvH [Actinomycetota bacterium]MBT4302800.1 glycine cleavage system protein GcvH [Actinomycetota bacterium]